MNKHYQYIETDGDEVTVHLTADQLKSLVIDADGDEEAAADIILKEIYPLIWSDARRGGHTRTIKRRKKGSEYSIYTMEADDDDDVDICPYSDRLCHNGFDCADCSIEAEEQAWVEEDDDE